MLKSKTMQPFATPITSTFVNQISVSKHLRFDCYKNVLLHENLLVVVLAGTLEFRHGRESYCATKDQLVFLKKGIIIDFIETKAGDTLYSSEFISIQIKSELVRDFIKLTESPASTVFENEPVIVGHIEDRLGNYMVLLINYLDSPHQQIDDSLVKLKLLELLCIIAKSHSNIFAQLLDDRESDLNSIRNVVEKSVCSPVTIRQLARQCQRSVSSFRRDFQAMYNMPPAQWIRNQRLEKSRQLLVNSKMCVTDVCYAMGFESLAHFSRLFKRRFGYPPTVARARSISAGSFTKI